MSLMIIVSHFFQLLDTRYQLLIILSTQVKLLKPNDGHQTTEITFSTKAQAVKKCYIEFVNEIHIARHDCESSIARLLMMRLRMNVLTFIREQIFFEKRQTECALKISNNMLNVECVIFLVI